MNCAKKRHYTRSMHCGIYIPPSVVYKKINNKSKKISLILYLSLPLFLPEKKDGIASLNSIWVYTDKGPVNKWIQKLFS